MAAHSTAAIHTSSPYFSPHVSFKWFGHVPISANLFLFKNVEDGSWRKFFNSISNGLIPRKEALAESFLEDYLQRAFALPSDPLHCANHVQPPNKIIHHTTKLVVFAASAGLKVARGKSFTKALKKFVVQQLKNRVVNYLYKKIVCCANVVARRQGYASCDFYPDVIKQEHNVFALAQCSWHMMSKTLLHGALNYCITSVAALSKQCDNQL